MERYADPNLVPSLLDEPARRGFSVVTITSGWPQDLERLIDSIAKLEADCEIIALSNNSKEVDAVLERDEGVQAISFSQHVGFGGGINAGIRRATGELVIVMDPSVEGTGDFLSPIRALLRDPSVGIAGRWGLTTSDLREYMEADGGEVDAMQSYLIAFRRQDVKRAGLFDPKFTFYRHADIDLSFKFKDLGLKVIAADLPVTRHPHREWESLTQGQRDTKSRSNHARLMRKWAGRTDLLVSPAAT